MQLKSVNKPLACGLLAIGLLSNIQLALADYNIQDKTYVGVAAKPSQANAQEIAALFDRWNAALATGRVDEVVKLYAKNAVLQPTVSNEVRTTSAAIKDYFEHFLPLKPKGVINSREIRVLDENTALDAGVYTFSLVKAGKSVKVQARYTFLYEKVDGDWKIMDHHSSAMPEKTNEKLM